MKRVLGLIWRIIVALVALALVVLKSATEVKFIGGDPQLEFVLLVAAGVAVFLESVVKAVQLIRRPAIETKKKRLEKAVLSCLQSISASTAIDVSEIGGSAFVIRRPFPWFALQRAFPWVGGNRVLRRVLRLRLNDEPQPSKIKWTLDKGAIGSAARTGEVRHADWTAYATALNTTTGQEAVVYQNVPEDQRFGLSQEDFCRMARKYSESLAIPLIDSMGTRIIGSLSIDIPYESSRASQGRVLKSPETTRAVACAAVVADIILDGS